jgi:hypothetical protein
MVEADDDLSVAGVDAEQHTLGGGSASSTIGGAAGAGVSSLLAPQTKEPSDAVAGATGSSLIGNLTGNIASGMGGAIIGRTAGAAGASNMNLYNQGNNDKKSQGMILWSSSSLHVVSGG